MTTPQKILKEYLKGVSKVLNSNPPEEEIKEITRIKNMFSTSIELIDYFSGRESYYTHNKRLNSVIKSLENELKYEREINENLKKKINSLIKIIPHQTNQTLIK